MGPIGDCPLWVIVRIKRGGVHSTVPDTQKINSSRVLVLVPLVLLLLEACVLSCFSCVQFFVTLWTTDLQASLFMGLSRQEYWHGKPWQAIPHSREASQPRSRSCDEILHSRKCRLFESPLFPLCSLHGLSTPLQSNILRAQLPCHLPWSFPREPQQMEMCVPTGQVLASVKAVLAQDDLSSLRALSCSDTMRSG